MSRRTRVAQARPQAGRTGMALRLGASPNRLVAPDAGRRDVERRPGLALRRQPKLAVGQRRGDAVGVEQEAPARARRPRPPRTKRRCCSSGSMTSGMPQIAVPTFPCIRSGSARASSKASPWMTFTPGRARAQMVGHVAARSRPPPASPPARPAASRARLITPVPAPSSTTTSSSRAAPAPRCGGTARARTGSRSPSAAGWPASA